MELQGVFKRVEQPKSLQDIHHDMLALKADLAQDTLFYKIKVFDH